MGTHLRNKYGQKLLDSAKKFTTDAINTASKRAIQKISEATSDLTGNKIVDKITSVSEKPKNNETNNESEVPKKIHISKRKTGNY